MTDIATATLPASAFEIALAGANDDYPQRQLARIDVLEEAVIYTGYDGGRPAHCYEIDARDVATALSGVPLATPFPLPANCLYYGRRGGEERVAIYLPPHTRALTAAVGGKRRHYKAVPLPGLVFWGEGTRYRVRALDRVPSAGAIAYHAPLPNVNDDGLICRGDVAFPRCSTAAIHLAAELFLTSDFNDHLVQGRSQKHPKNVLEAWKTYARAESYPIEDLVRAHHAPLAAEITGEHR